MNEWIVVIDEGIKTQDKNPISKDEISSGTINTRGVKVVMHWVYQGQYTNEAIEVDLFMKREDDNPATVGDVEDAFEELESIAREHGITKLKAQIDVDAEVMQAVGWEPTSSFLASIGDMLYGSNTWERELE